MWLLNTTNYNLHGFPSVEVAPKYAALSHRWNPTGEVTFADIQDLRRARRMTGWSKVEQACRTAQVKGYTWIWIDTCCIDKSSSAELSEAINSMFAWYLHCSVCLAYLNDVPAGDDPRSHRSAFRASQWFTRGWTLQELLAPPSSRAVLFFSRDWTIIGTREDLAPVIQEITAIDHEVLLGHPHVSKPIAQRMSWAARRHTTRPEDMAYALMGIFDINMPILYGEGGEKAFRRLQLEIIRRSDDQTIFGW
ncbi:HET-domain-containing protein, partial [Trametes sanguinea]